MNDLILTVDHAEYAGGHTLLLHFNNGQSRLYDFTREFGRGVCDKLRDINYFRRFTLDAFTVDWNNEIGFAPEYLLEGGTAV